MDIDIKLPEYQRRMKEYALQKSFTEALKLKYCMDQDEEQQTTGYIIVASPKRKTGAARAELAHLNTVVLNDMNLHLAGIPPGGLASLCPNIVDLDLSSNLFCQWSELLAILSHLPRLRYVNLSRNNLQLDSLNQLPETNLSVENLALNYTSVAIQEVVQLSQILPVLKELHLCGNDYSRLDGVDDCIRDGKWSSLECLRLNNNNITSWSEVWKLRHLPQLKQLILSGNPLTHIFYSNETLWADSEHDVKESPPQQVGTAASGDRSGGTAASEDRSGELSEADIFLNLSQTDCQDLLAECGSTEGEAEFQDLSFSTLDYDEDGELDGRPFSRLARHDDSVVTDSDVGCGEDECDGGNTNFNNSGHDLYRKSLFENSEDENFGGFMSQEDFETAAVDAAVMDSMLQAEAQLLDEGEDGEDDDFHKAAAEAFLQEIIDNLVAEQTSESLLDLGQSPVLRDVPTPPPDTQPESRGMTDSQTDRHFEPDNQTNNLTEPASTDDNLSPDVSLQDSEPELPDHVPQPNTTPVSSPISSPVSSQSLHCISIPPASVSQLLPQTETPTTTAAENLTDVKIPTVKQTSTRSEPDQPTPCCVEVEGVTSKDLVREDAGLDVSASETQCKAAGGSDCSQTPVCPLAVEGLCHVVTAVALSPTIDDASGWRIRQDNVATDPVSYRQSSDAKTSLVSTSLNEDRAMRGEESCLTCVGGGVSVATQPVASTSGQCDQCDVIQQQCGNNDVQSGKTEGCVATEPFHQLECLCLSEGKISHWRHLESLQLFPSLTNIRMLENPLYSSVNPEDRRKLYISSLPKVTMLNGSEVTQTEREKAETHFLRHFMDEEEKPGNYTTLLDKHGPPVQLVEIDLSAGYQEFVSITFILKDRPDLDKNGKSRFTKKIQMQGQMGELRKLIAKEMKIPKSSFTMFHFPCGPAHPDYERDIMELRCEGLPMSRFDFLDGDQIHIEMKAAPSVRWFGRDPNFLKN